MEKVLFLACRQIHLYLDQNKQKGGGKAGVSREQTSHYCQLLRNTEKQPMSSKHKKLEISPGTDYTLKSFLHAEQKQSEIKSSWQLGQALVEVADTANMCTTCRSPKISSRQLPTSSSLIATQLFEGNPWSIGTRNWRQPDQWPTKSIIQIKLKIRMNTEAMFRN